jgi:D-arabinose 5-phosphate isomerase GutQ
LEFKNKAKKSAKKVRTMCILANEFLLLTTLFENRNFIAYDGRNFREVTNMLPPAAISRKKGAKS